jgi:predicted O-linked N-acetylglucosamine transferase (SPINDLY family)
MRPLQQARPPLLPRSTDTAARLRIGYLSADFRDHAMGSLVHGLFAHHDRSRFEVFAYSIADLCDAYTRSVQAGVEHFSMVASDTAEQLADRIRADRIDVLIDLMGHTHHSRPGVLALRSAPLQLHYLGFPGTLGADFIDGVIADAWLIPPKLEPGYRERVHRLRWGFVSSPPPLEDSRTAEKAAPSCQPLCRRRLGLPDTAVVYACFSRPEKITPSRFNIWLEILAAVPRSALLLTLENPLARERLQRRAEDAGVDPGRLVFAAKVPSRVFPDLCRQADLLLDTAPYGVGATGVTALRAGLPLLTCPAATFASRMGASLCAAAGLEDLICASPTAYREKAIALGTDLEELRRLRQRLLEGQDYLPLFDTAGWVRNLEALLLRLLRQAAA